MVNLFKVLRFLFYANKRLYWDSHKLKRYQDKKIRRIVKYAYENVPFYHDCYKKHGIDVNSIQGLEDLSKLPIIKKDEFKAQPLNRIISSKFKFNSLKRVRTSGSTGTPFEVYVDSREDAWRKAIYMRANIACGQKPRDRWVVLTAPTHFGDTTKLQRKIGIFAQKCISLFEPSQVKIEQVAAAKPDILDGYSSALVLLAKEIKRKNLSSIKPHLVFGNAEFIDPNSRQCLEDVFGAPYCDQFGCAEVDRTAWQCLERQGYHMDVDSVITEFIDKNGESVSAGEHGEITYTSLFNYAMPFIRYSIGDIGVPSDENCSCGRKLPLMKIVEGRRDSFITFADNRVYSPLIFNYAVSTFDFYKDIDQYQVHQYRSGKIHVKLKMKTFSIPRDKMAMAFGSHLKKFFDLPQEEQFTISFVDEIPLSKTGKLRSVWSEVRPTD